MYFKYRDLKNYKHLIDIFVNQRLYSCSFRNLNDNFEGQFYSNTFQKIQRFRLNPKKEEHLSICSFTNNYKSHLMWSHYSDGHRGIVIGFTIDDNSYNIEKVIYNGLSDFTDLPTKFDSIKSVFLNKIKDWKYEEEYRIITEKQDFINIQIKKVIFGSETPSYDKEIITKLAGLVSCEIEIETYYG